MPAKKNVRKRIGNDLFFTPYKRRSSLVRSVIDSNPQQNRINLPATPAIIAPPITANCNTFGAAFKKN